MKAALVRAFGEINILPLVDVDDPEPGKGDVIVSVVLAEVNYPDVLVVEGRYQNSPPLPFAPGKVAVGVVTQVGPDVNDIRSGDRVIAQVEYGAFVERLRVPARQCAVIPADISLETAVGMGLPYQTAWMALNDRAELRNGEVVLVLGAMGGVGMASVQLAKALGASTVIAVTRGLKYADRLREAGADHVIDAGGGDIGTRLRETVKRISPEGGVDVVIDPVGGEAHSAALRTMNWRGRMVIVGFASNQIPSIKANYLLVKNISVLGIQWSDYRDKRPDDVRIAQAAMFRLVKEGKLKPSIEQPFAFEAAGKALAVVRDGAAKGRVVLRLP